MSEQITANIRPKWGKDREIRDDGTCECKQKGGQGRVPGRRVRTYSADGGRVRVIRRGRGGRGRRRGQIGPG